LERFVFTVKAPAALTHVKRLYGPEAWLAHITKGLTCLGNRRGVLLVQLPPSSILDHPRLAYFLERVPRGIGVCVEFRNPAWLQESIFALLEKHGAAYCVMSGAGLPRVLRATAPFVHVRLHGPDHHHIYAGSYSDNDLRWWADRVGEWQDMGREVFVYFKNDGEGNAVRNALTLKRMVGAGIPEVTGGNEVGRIRRRYCGISCRRVAWRQVSGKRVYQPRIGSPAEQWRYNRSRRH
jgi:uncharacterized protein YecE (DUF72 family)